MKPRKPGRRWLPRRPLPKPTVAFADRRRREGRKAKHKQRPHEGQD
jgi:hypothetical protein